MSIIDTFPKASIIKAIANHFDMDKFLLYLEHVKNSIENSANNGEHSVIVMCRNCFMQKTMQFLRDKGYTVYSNKYEKLLIQW